MANKKKQLKKQRIEGWEKGGSRMLKETT